MATVEDEHGMLWSAPICAHTKDEAIKIARKQDPKIPGGYTRLIYKCDVVHSEDLPGLPL